MGFEPQRRLFELDFSETEYAGLKVTTKSVPVKSLKKIIGLADQVDDADDVDAAAVLALIDDLFARFAKVLVSWNVTEGGEPVPATADGLDSQDLTFAMTVIFAWIKTITAAPPPLLAASPGGGTPPEASLPTEPPPSGPPS